MNPLLTIERIVAEHPALFVGAVLESPVVVSQLESVLGVRLPSSVKQLVLSHGSGLTSAVPNLKTSITDTQRFRAATPLPPQFVVLEDGNDAGVVLLDTSSEEGRVVWLDAHDICKLGNENTGDFKFDAFDRFEDWLLRCVLDIEGDSAI